MPDVVALQEVTHRSLPLLLDGLRSGGLIHAEHSLPHDRPESGARALGVVVASRYPLVRQDHALPLPWHEKGLSVVVKVPSAAVEVNTVHLPPGVSHGWVKIDIYEAIYKAVAKPAAGHRVLCGDFNSPQAELETGEVICWAKRLGKDGRWYLPRTRSGGDNERWELGEWNVLVGLREHDLHDVFRRLHGYAARGFSFETKLRTTITRRRFDHILASRSLRPSSCEYLHDLREMGLSDHAPIEAVFAG